MGKHWQQQHRADTLVGNSQQPLLTRHRSSSSSSTSSRMLCSLLETGPNSLQRFTAPTSRHSSNPTCLDSTKVTQGAGRKRIQLHRQWEAALQPWMKIDIELWLWPACTCPTMLCGALHGAVCQTPTIRLRCDSCPTLSVPPEGSPYQGWVVWGYAMRLRSDSLHLLPAKVSWWGRLCRVFVYAWGCPVPVLATPWASGTWLESGLTVCYDCFQD